MTGKAPIALQDADLPLWSTPCCSPTRIETFVWRCCQPGVVVAYCCCCSCPPSLLPARPPRFVEQEVDRVKQLFERKESRLRSERDEAAQQAEAAAAATAHLEAKVGRQHRNAEHQTCCSLVTNLPQHLAFVDGTRRLKGG